jgi:mannan endo-1,4-beta-mannosidase
MFPKRFVIAKHSYVFLLMILLTGCSGFWPFGEKDDFIKVRGMQLVHNDEPYYFLGTNLWYACNLGAPGIHGDRARLLRELDSLKVIGITNIRLLAGSEQSAMKRTLRPSITKTPGVYDDTLLLGLDFTIAEMGRRKMKAVLFLTNYWEWSGGMAQYVVWADSVPTFDPNVDGWDAFMNFSASFYHNEKANVLFRSYISKLLNRTNSVNGKKYCEDPTIMAWQLANEPRPGTISSEGIKNVPHFLRWIDETAGFIQSLDTNHLVTTGSEGIIGSLRNEEIYRTAHMSNNIDYMTMHLWPGNWKWYDPKEQERSLPEAIDSSLEYIANHISTARKVQKPLVLEEFGIVRDNGDTSPENPTTNRNRFFERILSLLYDSARAGSPVAGSNFWAWGGEGKNINRDYIWREGDPFTGDPPHEPQGMHSIFSHDVATISVLQKYAKLMNRLCISDSLLVHSSSQ